jgi:hypothetical protein
MRINCKKYKVQINLFQIRIINIKNKKKNNFKAHHNKRLIKKMQKLNLRFQLEL